MPQRERKGGSAPIDIPSKVNRGSDGMFEVHVTPGPRTGPSGQGIPSGARSDASSAFPFDTASPIIERQEGNICSRMWHGARALRHLSRPFGRVHKIEADEFELKRHPSIMGRPPNARVTRFFLWRKWTLIVILIQMYMQAAIDITNFVTFIRDPFEQLCPVRPQVQAREAADTAAAAAAATTRANVREAERKASADRWDVGQEGYDYLKQLPDSITQWAQRQRDAFKARAAKLSDAATLQEAKMMAAEEGHSTGEGVPDSGLGAGARWLAEVAVDDNGDVELMQASSSSASNKTCPVCQAAAKAGLCYRYFATPGLTELVKRSDGNEARLGTLGFRMLNSSEPVTLFYVCNTREMGNITSSCFYDGKLVVKRNCSIWLHSNSYKMLDMYTSFAHVRYAPDAALNWGDCNASHVQVREPVCLMDGRLVGQGFCKAGGLSAPEVSQVCCSSYEDMYDAVYNDDYWRVTYFFDVVALFVSFSRVLSTHMAIRMIDNYRLSLVFVVWAWFVPLIGSFVKYSWPLNSFVGQTGRQQMIKLMSSAMGFDAVGDNNQLSAIMADALKHSAGYDPIALYILKLIDILRSYMVYSQATGLVMIEFYYRFLYAFFALGEIGSLAVGVLPGFRSAAVVLKTLLPESSMLGWLVSFGPLVYVPFLACALAMMIQVFSDRWFTLAAFFYTLSNVAQAIFFWRNSYIYANSDKFRNQLVIQDVVRGTLAAAAFAFLIVFVYTSQEKGQQDAKNSFITIGWLGWFSFCIRVVFNFQLASVFTADAVLYFLRSIARESRNDRLANMEYEKALEEFGALDTDDAICGSTSRWNGFGADGDVPRTDKSVDRVSTPTGWGRVNADSTARVGSPELTTRRRRFAALWPMVPQVQPS